MVAFQTADGSIDLPDVVVRAVAQQASLQAELTVETLRVMGFEPNANLRLPGAFLLELGAIAMLKLWELGGQKDHFPVSVPDFEAAKSSLVERCQGGQEAFADIADTPVSKQVLRIYIDYFAWEGKDDLDATFVIGSVPEDQFVDVLAEFLWMHRHELQSVLRRTEE